VVIETDAPAKIVFNDHRRFGLMTLVPTDQLDHDKLFKDIGIEPLSEKFNAKYLTHALDGKKTSIKAALLDQRVVAGLGNIYVSEALFLAHISPKKLAGAVKKEQIAALVKAIKAVLKDAIAAGGSTLRDHAQATGDPGSFQHRFRVYGREGMPCRNTRASSSEAIGHQKKCRGPSIARPVRSEWPGIAGNPGLIDLRFDGGAAKGYSAASFQDPRKAHAEYRFVPQARPHHRQAHRDQYLAQDPRPRLHPQGGRSHCQGRQKGRPGGAEGGRAGDHARRLQGRAAQEHGLAEGFTPHQARRKTAKIAEAAGIIPESPVTAKSRKSPIPKIGLFLLSVR
jgi:hypothetical protein